MTLIKLYDLAAANEQQRFSPYCWRIHMALKHKQLPFATIPWRFSEKEVIAFSGQGLVPVLVDGERTISDSWPIAEYLEQAYPDQPSLFGSPDGKRHARFIKHWTESLHPMVSKMIILDIHNELHEKDKPYFRESREKRFGKTLEEVVADREDTRKKFAVALSPLRLAVAEEPFLCGGKPGFADYIVFGMFQWSRCSSAFPIILAEDTIGLWQKRMLELFDGYAASFPTASKRK